MTDERMPWWADPAAGLATFALPGAFLAVMVPAAAYPMLWGARKYVGWVDVAVAVVAVATFTAGSAWARLVVSPPAADRRAVDDAAVHKCFRLLYWLAVASYVLWALVGVRRGVRMADVRASISGVPFATFRLKQLLAPVSGVTTFTQVVPVAAALAAVLARRGRWQLVWRPLCVLAVLAILRSYFFSERLAILELALPVVLVLLFVPGRSPSMRLRRTAVLFPLAYVASAAALFAVFEYNRSWAYYRHVLPVSYPTFAAQRFLGYYTTPPNNSSFLRGRIGAVPVAPFTLQWLDELPLLDRVVDVYPGRLVSTEALAGLANPEFNTEGALYAPAIDWGVPASIPIWFIGGAAITVVFVRTRYGDVTLLPLYATLYLGIVESGRYFYWGLGRAVLPMTAAAGVCWYLRRSPSPIGAAGAGGAHPVARERVGNVERR